MLVLCGAGLRKSLFIEYLIIGVAFLRVLHRFGLRVMSNGAAAILVSVLVILNGGLGWAMLFGDVNKSDAGVFHVLMNIQHSYTILPDVTPGWRWGIAVSCLVVPQRGIWLGV